MNKAEKILKKLRKLRLDPAAKYFFTKYGPLVSKLRRDPIFQARILHGVALPPHERAMLRTIRYPQYNEYHFVGSRGTAKSFTICSAAPVLYAEVYGKKKISSLSASKFRGGKVIMEEALNFLTGALDSQRLPGKFTNRMMVWSKGLKREGDRWYMSFTSETTFTTIPTGNEESARGLRANLLFLDEADNWEKKTVDKIFGPFLAVDGNFERPGQRQSGNKIFFTGTVSYSHKDWAKALIDREDVLRKKYEAYKKLLEQDFTAYNNLMNQDDERIKRASFSLQRWDYVDLIIPKFLKNHAVVYPLVDTDTKSIEEADPTFDQRDKKQYIYTYPVNKNFAESQLDDGLTDFDTWAAEWRCQFIDTSGNVYPYELIDRAINSELFEEDYLKARGWSVAGDAELEGALGPYYPPVLYKCTDPCVLGVDPARTSDYTAFVVIRLGELAEGEYDPLTGCGHTPWNNVIWAEQRKNMTIRDIAEKIHEFKSRYNLVVHENPEKAPGIAIDARGQSSGATIRDELAVPSPRVDQYGNVDPNWKQPQPIYDPTDKEYLHLKAIENAWPGLRILWTSDQINTELVSFSKGQLEAGKLYIGRYISRLERPVSEYEVNAGYAGVESLKNQLLAIQSIPTMYAFKYHIPGSNTIDKNKKDLFSAFLYASYAARQHIALKLKTSAKPPATAGVIVRRKRQLGDHPYMRY